MNIGVIGTGHIGSAMVEGLARNAPAAEQLILSPRGAEHAARLAAAFSGVRIARHNQAVVDASEIVLLCVRPAIVREVLGELRFREGQLVISVVALTPLDLVGKLAAPASVVRAVPIPAAKRAMSPTAIFPAEPRARALFERLGSALVMRSERELSVVWTATALISPTYALLDEVSRWLVGNGVPLETASQFTVEQFRGILALAERERGGRFGDLARGAATPGGLNEQALKQLGDAGVFDAVGRALDVVLARLLEAQTVAARTAGGRSAPG